MKRNILSIFIFASVLLFSTISNAQANQKEVVIFSQPCHFCDLMKDALANGIISNNEDVKFTILDIREPKNHRLLVKYARDYDLDQSRLGLPLLFIGENYIMGWGDNAPEELNGYLEELRKE